MTPLHDRRFFVCRLDERSNRPVPSAGYQVQILNEEGEGEICAFIASDSEEVVALIQRTEHARIALPIGSHEVPSAVIKAARQRITGFGEYVNSRGEIIDPF